ncbi:IS66 family transposase [Dehalococcoidia bacterium]|nr:IS66 family transposase [Dehalococcoidia bacterium]
MYNENMATEISEISSTLAELRWQINYWRAQHTRAVERETVWKEKAQQLQQLVLQQKVQITELNQQIEALKAKVAWLQQQMFGRKSEQTKDLVTENHDGDQEASDASEAISESGKNRGKQPGSKGYGRKRCTELPTEEIPHELPKTDQCCPRCGKPFSIFPGTEDSEEIHWEIHVVRHVHKRTRYRPTCNCRAVLGIMTAPPVPKLIPKGMFSCSFWVHLLLEKFLFQRPLYRIRQVLALEGLSVSQGTLTGGLKRIGELIDPLYRRILERSRAADHWHMDETRWMVFAEAEGKSGHRWWLWVVVTHDTCAYLLEPTRSAKVPKNHLGEDAMGIINADRYAVYKSLGEKIRIAFCWSHVRRDFVRIHDVHERLRTWATTWIERINELFDQNAKRIEVLANPDAFRVEDQALREAVASMVEVREEELAHETLHPAQRKALKSMRTHWEGLTLFVDYPEIPMDNNESERRLRNPVVGRKNYYGSGSIWSGILTAALFTIFQTLLLNHIDPQKYLLAYFEACARNGGRPPEDIESFLPWNLSAEQKAVWRYPRAPP